MGTEDLLGAAMLGALVAYALLAGADFGGGVWDLLAWGPRRAEQRHAIEGAIGPVWEANHVWLILVVVVLFTAFPTAFAAVCIGLHLPLAMLLVAVLFRGTAFTFRHHDLRGAKVEASWGLVFSLASVAGPLLLGACVGALASGRLAADLQHPTLFGSAAWLGPFPSAVGFFALTLFAFLAATYLTVEAPTPELRDDFRARALASGLLLGLLAALTFYLSAEGAPRVREGLTARPWSWPLHLLTGASATTALASLYLRRFQLARVAAAAQGALLVLGWGASQYPYLVVPGMTLHSAAAPAVVQRLLLAVLALGALVLVPSLYALFRVFKRPA